ncbi:MAG: patatin-like phospholipase family protein [Verrucomicrobiota bacterium]
MTNTYPTQKPGTGILRSANDAAEHGSNSAVIPASPPRIGLALSSGGARGLAHVGVLQVLEENNIPIAAIAGASMGAYVGAIYAAGYDGAELERLAKEITDKKALRRLLDFVIPPTAGLIRGNKIRKHLERTLGELTFEQLKIPMLVVATDLNTLQPYAFESGPVAPAIHASAAIPGICMPVTLGDQRFTDGGAADPLPVTLLRKRFNLDAVIAVNVMPTHKDISLCGDTSFAPLTKTPSLISRLLRPINLLADGNVLDVFRRALMCAQVGLGEKEGREAEVLIHPYHCGSSWNDFENHARYIETGRHAAEAALPAIRALLSRTSPQPNTPNHETVFCSTEMGCLAA